MKCPHCGGENIKTGIKWGQSADIGSVGLSYSAGFMGIVGNESVYSDLCLDCGTIVRTYVKDPAARNWLCSK